MLASGSADTTILLWDVSSLKPDLPPANLSAEALDNCWADLQAADAARAYRSVWSLVAGGDKVVRFLAEKVHPTPGVDAKRLQQWLSDLDSGDFSAREGATRELTRLGSVIESELCQLRDATSSPEVRKRVNSILEQIAKAKPSGDPLRQLRAIVVLERIGSPAARDLLKKLADGAPGAALTRNAKLALQRLERRAKKP
jgi:hypothetical protein